MSIISSMSIFYNIVNCIRAGNHGSLYPSRTGSSRYSSFPKRRIFQFRIRLHYTGNCDNNIPEPPAPIPGASSKMLRRLLAAAPSFLPSRCTKIGIYCFDPFWLPGTMGADGNYDLKQDPS